MKEHQEKCGLDGGKSPAVSDDPADLPDESFDDRAAIVDHLLTHRVSKADSRGMNNN